ncbi:alpha-tocopherol transfer protein-like [Tribolium castaneum]|uniref:Alpha-tocopherol transfer protein-like Protein n=1 Tax=Tribolium castaneum TaxID=7070 RepID=D6X3G0_TRICA|nr:PREDICTED: alpha-tocopherol transfer protein-like [Tribolium castaneum]EEZ97415.1 Alpha-tocopherol transfer protein-like Protein [Tribolium castaneum]|eukprot:XP_966309.1 PREDICTED: alpha-tocopherol transfer protein-like [Tribolium castaneum]
MDLLRVTPDERAQILDVYKIGESQIKQDIEIIQTWKSKRPHLVAPLSDDFIEKLLIKNKFSVERCKEKIENYYTLRGANLDLVADWEKIVPSKLALTCLPLPHVTKDCERIVIMQLINPDPKAYDAVKTLKLTLAISELMLRYDGSLGIRFLIDFKGFTLAHLATLNPMVMLRYNNMVEKGYSLRILGLEFVNCPSYVNKISALFKMFLRPKIYQRIKLHENLDSLHESIPKEYLPIEYEGTRGNISDLLGKWDSEMEKQRDFLSQCLKIVSNEELRPPEMQENDMFGMGGTFKTLSVD